MSENQFKKYQCHKIVDALPMTRGTYNLYRQWEIPQSEDPNEEGYLVIYGRGTPDHYESWSPKKQFDEGYAELGKRSSGKTYHNSDVSGASKNVPDIKFFGDGDTFKLISKASSKSEGWMKSTKAMEINGIGCVVQVTTQQGDNVAEAVTFVPGVRIQETEKDSRKLVAIEA